MFTSSRLSMTAISTTTHELSIAEYERIRPEIRRIVLCGMLEHGGMYTAVDMKAIPAEPGHEVSLPTVYILFHNPQDIAHRLAGIMTQLRMEIHKGGTQFFNIAGPRNAAFEQEVTIGHSIGVKGAASSGTMGGYLYEASTGNRFGLTNGHVCGMLMKKSLESLPMIMDGEGVPVEIVQNSDQDQEGFFEDAKLAYDTAANKAAECGGLDTRRNMRELEAKKKFDIIKGQNRLFGVVVRAELGIWNSPALEEDRCWKDYGVILPIKGMNRLDYFVVVVNIWD